jgi:aspartyl-tRNA(Asn)/glutamyl-tRNA(Gln) amidotransferase subunit B
MSPDVMAKYEVVIGLEVHAQLSTRTKIFCSCPTSFGAQPNSNVCPVCLGLPGALPVLSRGAVELGAKGALALNCTVQPESVFARKNYFYPDLPKGYQISQFDKPLALAGHLDVHVNGETKRIGITRVHMEDDAGKSVHDGFKDSDRFTYVDLNRSGTPLIEIVSEPDIRSADEAVEYFNEVRQALVFAEVSACDMEKGHLRCDANVSMRLKGAEKFGTRAEVKNLNSFRFLKQAIEFEMERQVEILESGGRVIQETRLFNPDLGETISMRSKEEAHDYRYFPEPDLIPVRVNPEWLAQLKASMPELPQYKRQRYTLEFGIRPYDARILTQSREVADFFEGTATKSSAPQAAANWITGDLAGLLRGDGKSFAESPVTSTNLAELIVMTNSGDLSGKLAKDILPKMYSTGDAPSVIAEREGLKQISDTGALEKIVDEIIAANPKQVEQYKGGKTTVIGFLVGQVMKQSRGQANPATVNAILAEKLK